MSKIGSIELLATIDTSKYKKGAEEIEKANKDVEKSAERSSNNISHHWQRLSKAVVSAAKVSSVAIATSFAASVKSVANLEQSLGGSEVVFGKFSDSIQKNAKESSRVMGTSMNSYLETANKMGSLFQGAGFSVKKSMSLTSDSMQRATDVATAMGVSTEMALESIAGAAKGNFTMMDNLGVAMNDTTLQAYALEKGIDKTTQEMTNQEKVSLAMQLFMEKTSKYAGNYARENATLAGSFQTLKSDVSNFLSGVDGSAEALGSSIVNVGSVLRVKLPEIAQDLAQGVSDLVNKLFGGMDWSKTGKTIGEAIASALDNLAGFIGGVDWGKIGVEIGKNGIAFAVGLISGLLSEEALSAGIDVVKDNWQALLLGALGIVFAPAKMVGVFTKFLGPVGRLLRTFLINPIRKIFAPIRNAFGAIFGAGSKAAGSMLARVGVFMRTVWNIITAPFKIAIDYVANLVLGIPITIGNALSTVRGIFAFVFNGAWNVVKFIFSPVIKFFGNIVNKIKAKFSPIPRAISGFFSRAYSSVRGVFGGIVGYFYGKVSSIINAFRSIPGRIRSFFVSAVRNITHINWGKAGSDLVRGLWNGISNMAGWIKDKIQGFGEGVLNSLKDFFGIKSPSRLMRDQVGKFIGQGIGIGIDKSTPDAVGAARRTSNAVLGGFGNMTPSFGLNDVSSVSRATPSVPTQNQPRPATSPTSIVININGTFATSAAEQRKVANVIAKRLMEVQNSKALGGDKA